MHLHIQCYKAKGENATNGKTDLIFKFVGIGEHIGLVDRWVDGQIDGWLNWWVNKEWIGANMGQEMGEWTDSRWKRRWAGGWWEGSPVNRWGLGSEMGDSRFMKFSINPLIFLNFSKMHHIIDCYVAQWKEPSDYYAGRYWQSYWMSGWVSGWANIWVRRWEHWWWEDRPVHKWVVS